MADDDLTLTGAGTVFDPPISTEPDDIELEMQDEMAAQFNGWVAIPTALDTQLIAVQAQVSAESRAAVADQIVSHLLALLGSLFGVPRQEGLPARGSITVRAIDQLGHTIDVGTTVTVGDVECQTVDQLVIPAGQDHASVAIATVNLGADANGATGSVQIDAFDWIDDAGVILGAPLDRGADPETDQAHSVRLADELQILTFRPLQPADWVVLARRHQPVQFAWAINLYDAQTDTDDQELTVTVVVAGEQAAELSADELAEVDADLQSRRPMNFIVRTVSPTYRPVSVTCTVVAEDGWDTGQVQTMVHDQLAVRLSPAVALQPPYGQDPGFVPAPLIHTSNLIAEALKVPGVARVMSLQIGDGSSPQVEFGRLELPEPAEIDVTVA